MIKAGAGAGAISIKQEHTSFIVIISCRLAHGISSNCKVEIVMVTVRTGAFS